MSQLISPSFSGEKPSALSPPTSPVYRPTKPISSSASTSPEPQGNHLVSPTSPANYEDGLEAAPHWDYPEVVASPVLSSTATYTPSKVAMGDYRPSENANDNYMPSPATKRDYLRAPGQNDAPPSSKIASLRRTTFILVVLLILAVTIGAVGGGVGGTMAVKKAYDRGIAEGAIATVTVTAGTPAATGESTAGATSGDSTGGSGDAEDSGDSGDSTDDPVDTTDDGSTNGSADSSAGVSSASSAPAQATVVTQSNGRLGQPPTSGFAELDCPAISGTTHTVSPGGPKAVFKLDCERNHPAANSVDITLIPAYSYHDCLTACAGWNVQAKSVPGVKCVGVAFGADLRVINVHGGNCWLKSDIGESVLKPDNAKKNNAVEGILVQ